MIGKFIPEIPGENVIYPGKKIPRPGPTRNKIPRPGPTRNRITRPDPTRKYSLKCSPTPDRFRSGPVRSGETRGFGLPRRSLHVVCKRRYILKKKMIFDLCDLEWPLMGSRVTGHLRATSLVIVTKFDQNWFMHFGTTLYYVVDRKKERKNLRETEHRWSSPV